MLQRLQEEFAVELAELRGRVDALEARSAELEANQFSTTTKLDGEIIFWLTDTYGDRAQARGEASANDKTQTNLSYRVRLNFETSFTGKDLLYTRLQATDIPDLNSIEVGGWFGTTWARPETDGGDDDDVTIINGMFYVAFPDLFKEGNMGSIMVGVPPIVTDSGDNDSLKDDDTSIHIEAIYRFQLNDNISVPPGLFVITNPNHDDFNIGFRLFIS